MLVTNLDYDEHKGRIAIGRVTSGKISRAETVVVGRPGAPAHRCANMEQAVVLKTAHQKAAMSVRAANTT